MSDQDERREEREEEVFEEPAPGYDPARDPIVKLLEQTDDQEKRNELERSAMAQTENGPKTTDPDDENGGKK